MGFVKKACARARKAESKLALRVKEGRYRTLLREHKSTIQLADREKAHTTECYALENWAARTIGIQLKPNSSPILQFTCAYNTVLGMLYTTPARGAEPLARKTIARAF